MATSVTTVTHAPRPSALRDSPAEAAATDSASQAVGNQPSVSPMAAIVRSPPSMPKCC